MKVLITGSEGFVGSNLVPKLVEENDVTALDYIITSRPFNLPDGVRFVNADLSRPLSARDNLSEPISMKVPNPDLIIHLATINQLAVDADPSNLTINIASTLNVLKLARLYDARLIFSSSCSVYGSGTDFKEIDPVNPKSLYAVGKCTEEGIAKFYHDRFGLDVCILRYSNCYGDVTRIRNKVYPGKEDVIRIFMTKVLNGEPVPLIRGRSRDFTYIDDVIDATCAVLDLEGFHVFNVATGVETYTDELPSKVGAALGIPVSVTEIQPRSTDDLMRRSLNIDAISPYWKPKYSLDRGLKLYAEKLKADRI